MGGPSGAAYRSPHFISETITGQRSRPFSVRRYSKRSGFSRYAEGSGKLLAHGTATCLILSPNGHGA